MTVALVMIAVLVVVVAFMARIIKVLSDNFSVCEDRLQKVVSQLRAQERRVYETNEKSTKFYGELQETREQLQESKMKFGTVRKSLAKTLDDIQGKGFRNKNGSIERSKQFRSLKETLDKLKTNGNGGSHE